MTARAKKKPQPEAQSRVAPKAITPVLNIHPKKRAFPEFSEAVAEFLEDCGYTGKG